MALSLTPEDLSKLSSLITAATQEHAKGVVEREVQRIPYEVRSLLQSILRTELRDLVQAAIADHISVTVKVKTPK